jgi:hypothetical protein
VPLVEDCDDSDPTVAVLTENGYCTTPPDAIAPVITAVATPSTLWPPNGKPVSVVISGTVTDIGSGVDPNTSRYQVNDEYGDVQPSGPVVVGSDGSYAFTVSLPASRRGRDKHGREYIITVSAEDHAGNPGSTATAVRVPHDMSGKVKDQ